MYQLKVSPAAGKDAVILPQRYGVLAEALRQLKHWQRAHKGKRAAVIYSRTKVEV